MQVFFQYTLIYADVNWTAVKYNYTRIVSTFKSFSQQINKNITMLINFKKEYNYIVNVY